MSVSQPCQLSVDGGLGSERDQRETINIQAAEDETRTRPDMDLEQVLKKGNQKDLGERKATFLQFHLLLSHSQRGFWVPERGPTGPQKGDLPVESINVRLSVDPFRPMHVVYFPKAIICIFKPNQKLDGGG